MLNGFQRREKLSRSSAAKLTIVFSPLLRCLLGDLARRSRVIIATDRVFAFHRGSIIHFAVGEA
jgi:hypothetical protein